MTTKPHNHQTRTVGGTVGTEEYTGGAFGDGPSRTYVDLGALGLGASGNIAAAFGQNSAGAGTSLSTSVNEPAPGTASTAISFAGRFWLTRALGGPIDFIAPRVSAGKMSSLLISATGTVVARYGGAGSASGDTNIGTPSAAMSLNTEYNFTYCVQTGAGTGQVYLKWWAAGGSTLYEQELLTAQTGTGNAISANLGKPSAIAGTIIIDDFVSENAYNKLLVPLQAMPVASHTESVIQRADFSASTGTGLVLTFGTQTSGPAVTPNITGMVATFTDVVRTVDIVFPFTLTDSIGQTATGTVVFPPSAGTTKRVGPLIMLGGTLL